ncbi:MAG: hypothetical protein JKY47_09900 [Thalassospira sp.]|nr:hypothetical protein [Thalassospira sp.]
MSKTSFFKAYSNLPINIRKEIVLDLGEPTGPISWEVAYTEINADTTLGDQILSKLNDLGIVTNEQ